MRLSIFPSLLRIYLVILFSFLNNNLVPSLFPIEIPLLIDGGSVPKAVTEESRKLVRDCDSILAIGTTLSTYSAFRLFRDAAQDRKPIAILTDGPTRADELADLKFEARCSEMLVEVEAVLA